MRTPVRPIQHCGYTEILTRVTYQYIRLYYHNNNQRSPCYPPNLIIEALNTLPVHMKHQFIPFFVGAAKWVAYGVTLADWRSAYPEMRGYRRLDKQPIPPHIIRKSSLLTRAYDEPRLPGNMQDNDPLPGNTSDG